VSALLGTCAKLFLSVASISCQASVLVFLVLAAQLLLGRKLSLRWRHALWFLVLARLVLPELPASPFSIYQVAPQPVTINFFAASVQDVPSPAATTPAVPAGISKTNDASGLWLVRAAQWATVVWLAGLIGLASATSWTNFRFLRKLQRDRQVPRDQVIELTQACAAELGVRQSFSVRETSLVSSPAIFGLWHASLLLPVGLAEKLSGPELRLVILHELAHLQRADLYHHALLSVLQVIHWFNPLLWFAFARMRDDREMATDALVLSGDRAALKTQYGHTLLKLIESAQSHPLAIQMVGILENPEQLRDRLTRINQATPGGYRWSLRGLALLCVLAALFLTRAYGQVDTLVIQAKLADQPWNGWGFSSPADHAPDATQAEEFDLVKDAAYPRVFSGRVKVPCQLNGLEVGLVSLVGVHWVNPDAYQWQAVSPDGTFSIKDSRYLNASKALVLRGPNTPWTFLRYNFAPNESGTNIILHGDEARKIALSVSGADGRDLPQASFEFFPAHAQYDDSGQTLRRQRLGEFESGGNTLADVVAPAGEVAVFAHRDGYASYYQVIDTRQADHFRFVLQHPGRMKITVLDRDGHPKSGVRVDWLNAAAPLSLSGTSTDGNGVIVQPNLSPGNFDVSVTGFASFKVKIQENQLTEVNLREGTGP
jgi:beta-lactamase regulating signal transducer with metallopeptidase domain